MSTEGASASVLIKMSLTPEQLGADISFLSCFPTECEHLYGPGTYIEPKPERGGARMPGAVKTVEAQIHVKEQPLLVKMNVDGGADGSFVAEGGGGGGAAAAAAPKKAAAVAAAAKTAPEGNEAAAAQRQERWERLTRERVGGARARAPYSCVGGLCRKEDGACCVGVC